MLQFSQELEIDAFSGYFIIFVDLYLVDLYLIFCRFRFHAAEGDNGMFQQFIDVYLADI